MLQHLEAVGNAIIEPWSNSQTEGQINRLKTLKRAVYGHAGVELLRTRMLQLRQMDEPLWHIDDVGGLSPHQSRSNAASAESIVPELESADFYR